MSIETLGVDIAKNVFQLHGVNRNGRVVLKRRVMRDQLVAVLTQIERCTVVIEACTGAFYWARKFEALGHQVKIISPQYVKPFVRRQKNDGNDAEAICTAARQRHIPSSSRISRRCIGRGRGWSITEPPSLVKSAACYSIAASHRHEHYPRAPGDPGDSGQSPQ
jgi:transposase